AANASMKAAYDKAVADYNKAVSARTAALATNDQMATKYKADMAAYTLLVAGIKQKNDKMYADFNAYKASYDQKKSQYDAIVSQRTAILKQQQAASDAVLKSVTPPPGYSGCITADQRNGYQSACDASKVVVRGTDGLGAIPSLVRAVFGLS